MAVILQSGAELTKLNHSLLQSGVDIKKWGNFITKYGRYYKEEQLLQRRLVHLRDTGTNGDPCLLIGPMQLESRVV